MSLSWGMQTGWNSRGGGKVFWAEVPLSGEQGCGELNLCGVLGEEEATGLPKGAPEWAMEGGLVAKGWSWGRLTPLSLVENGGQGERCVPWGCKAGGAVPGGFGLVGWLFQEGVGRQAEVVAWRVGRSGCLELGIFLEAVPWGHAPFRFEALTSA